MNAGDIYDSMMGNVTELNIDGRVVKSLADLSKMTSLRELTIKKFQNINPYLKTIGSIKTLKTLRISKTVMTDLSFVKDLPCLTRLLLNYNKITDISALGNLTGITYLDISNNNISVHSPVATNKNMVNVLITCNRNEDLNFLKQFTSLTSFTIDGNGKVRDFSFIKNFSSWVSICIYNASIYADMSVLLAINDNAGITTDEREGKESVTRLIASNAKARQIIADIIKPGMSDIQKELVIQDYITSNVEYGYKGRERTATSFTPYGALIIGHAVCEGYSKAFNMLINAAGVDCIIAAGRGGSTAEAYPHAWNIITLDGEYYCVGPTWNDSPGVNKYMYFNVTSSELRGNHLWEEDQYPVCNGMKYHLSNIDLGVIRMQNTPQEKKPDEKTDLKIETKPKSQLKRQKQQKKIIKKKK